MTRKTGTAESLAPEAPEGVWQWVRGKLGGLPESIAPCHCAGKSRWLWYGRLSPLVILESQQRSKVASRAAFWLCLFPSQHQKTEPTNKCSWQYHVYTTSGGRWVEDIYAGNTSILLLMPRRVVNLIHGRRVCELIMFWRIYNSSFMIMGREASWY